MSDTALPQIAVTRFGASAALDLIDRVPQLVAQSWALLTMGMRSRALIGMLQLAAWAPALRVRRIQPVEALHAA